MPSDYRHGLQSFDCSGIRPRLGSRDFGHLDFTNFGLGTQGRWLSTEFGYRALSDVDFDFLLSNLDCSSLDIRELDFDILISVSRFLHTELHWFYLSDFGSRTSTIRIPASWISILASWFSNWLSWLRKHLRTLLTDDEMLFFKLATFAFYCRIKIQKGAILMWWFRVTRHWIWCPLVSEAAPVPNL